MPETLPVGSAAATGVDLTVNIGGLTQTAAVAVAEATAVSPDDLFGNTVSLSAGNARARASILYTEVIRPRGRERIAVDQPLAGSSYPFRKQGTTLSTLVADAYLAYEDPGCEFVRPFRIGMLYGFGTNTNSIPTGFNEATHEYDVVILDAEDNVVFDSTLLDDDRVSDQYWGERLQIVEWKGDDAVCRLAVFTAWGVNDTPTVFNVYQSPDDALLDDRALERMPQRVRSLRVGLTQLEATDVVLAEGYNSAVTLGTTETVGRRKLTSINVSGSPGDGLGRFNDCEEQLNEIRRINAVGPDDRGNLKLDVGGCYRVEPPHTLVNGVAQVTANTLKLYNDCGPCADCDDYLKVYEAVRRLYARYVELGQRAEAVRDQYAANKTRWETETACRRNNKLRIAASTTCPCFMSLAIGYCNSTDDTECLTGLELRVTLSGTAVTGGSAACGKSFRTGNVVGDCPPPSVSCNEDGNIIVPYTPSGTWPTLTMAWDAVRPNGMAVGSFQLEFPDCQAADEIGISLSAYIDGELAAGPIAATVPLSPATDSEGGCC